MHFFFEGNFYLHMLSDKKSRTSTTFLLSLLDLNQGPSD